MEAATKILSRKPAEKKKLMECETGKRRKWTEECDMMLIRDYRQGKTIWECADVYNREPGDVMARIMHLAETGQITPAMWGARAKGAYPRSPLLKPKNREGEKVEHN